MQDLLHWFILFNMVADSRCDTPSLRILINLRTLRARLLTCPHENTRLPVCVTSNVHEYDAGLVAFNMFELGFFTPEGVPCHISWSEFGTIESWGGTSTTIVCKGETSTKFECKPFATATYINHGNMVLWFSAVPVIEQHDRRRRQHTATRHQKFRDHLETVADPEFSQD